MRCVYAEEYACERAARYALVVDSSRRYRACSDHLEPMVAVLLSAHPRLSIEAIAPNRVAPDAIGHTYGTGRAPKEDEHDAIDRAIVLEEQYY